MRYILSILFLFACFGSCRGTGFRSKTIKIWAENSQGRSQVKLTPYLPLQGDSTTPAVIICPGGSYFWLDKNMEGHEVARWLQSCNIAAFVLEYRTGGKFNFVFGTRLLYGGNHFPYMLQDVQKAILTVRNNSEIYHINPQRIGVMGFSAGGHLAMLSAIYPSTEFLRLCSQEPSCSVRPDFVAPIYPPVTFVNTQYAHHRSKRGILGEYKMNNKTLADSLSIERHIPKDCPPVFLLNCIDDPIVNYRNSELLDSALTAQDVKHLYIQLPVGGHGFGCKDIESPEGILSWKARFLEWLETIF